MRKILILFLILSGSSYGQQVRKELIDAEDVAKQEIADWVRAEVAQKLHERFGLSPCGSGGRMMDKIERLSLAFDCSQISSLKQAREVLVESVNEFVQFVNREKRIRKYLACSPFSPKNVEISIYLQDKLGNKTCLKNGVSIVGCSRGYLSYKKNAPEGNKAILCYRESFEEAEKMVAESSINFKSSKACNSP